MTYKITIPRGYRLKDGKLIKSTKHMDVSAKIRTRKSKKVKPVRGKHRVVVAILVVCALVGVAIGKGAIIYQASAEPLVCPVTKFLGDR